MTDPYSVLGISPGADDETIKKAYRQKCKQYHPDLHPNDPSAEEKFKEVQAAYSEIMRRKQSGGQSGVPAAVRFRRVLWIRQPKPVRRRLPGGPLRRVWLRPLRVWFLRFRRRQPPDLYHRPGKPRDARRCELHPQRLLSGGVEHPERHPGRRTQRPVALLLCFWPTRAWANNIRARDEARTAVSMEPNNYAYQNLLDQLQNPGQTYTSYQQPYAPAQRRPGTVLPFVLDVPADVQHLQLVLLRRPRRLLLLLMPPAALRCQSKMPPSPQ